MWALSDITPGGGGLTVIPGSHKSHFPVPPEGPAAEQLVEITAGAGSVILFSHDIYHQSLNRSDRERRVMFLTVLSMQHHRQHTATMTAMAAMTACSIRRPRAAG